MDELRLKEHLEWLHDIVRKRQETIDANRKQVFASIQQKGIITLKDICQLLDMEDKESRTKLVTLQSLLMYEQRTTPEGASSLILKEIKSSSRTTQIKLDGNEMKAKRRERRLKRLAAMTPEQLVEYKRKSRERRIVRKKKR